MSTILDQAIPLFRDMVISRYMMGSGLTIMAYDWSLTLSDEIKYIWRAKWTPVKGVFLINRYFMPFTLIFGIYAWGGTATFLSTRVCKIFISTDSSILLTFFATLHWLVAMRAWALWGRTKIMGAVIWGAYLMYLTTSAYLLAKAMIALNTAPVFGVQVCFGDIPTFLWSIWLPSMVFETLVFLLTAIKAVQHNHQHVDTPILSILYRDGFLYFVFICVNSFMNLLIWAVGPPSYVILFKYFSAGICEVAGSHLILDLIEIGHLSGASRSGSSHHKKGRSFGYSPPSGDVFEMMPSPFTPNADVKSGNTELEITSGVWQAPEEWSVSTYQTSKSLVALLANQNTASMPRPPPTRTIQWSDQRTHIGEAV